MIPAMTVDAAQHWSQPIDFLYIDADHSAAGVLADLHAWVPHVRSGGLIAGDDYDHPRIPGSVQRGTRSSRAKTAFQRFSARIPTAFS